MNQIREVDQHNEKASKFQNRNDDFAKNLEEIAKKYF